MSFGVTAVALAALTAGVLEDSPFKELALAPATPWVAEKAIPKWSAEYWQGELTRLAEAGDVDGAITARAELRKQRYAVASRNFAPALETPRLRQGASVQAFGLPKKLPILPDPGNFNPTTADIGKSFAFQLETAKLGNQGDPAYGTGVYTGGSGLLNAARHAGAINAGESAVVVVDVLPGRERYEGSLQNGVMSQGWNKWNVSFTVRRGPAQWVIPGTP